MAYMSSGKVEMLASYQSCDMQSNQNLCFVTNVLN